MKYHKISLIGLLIGLVIIVCSVVKWFFISYDPSQMVFGTSIGIIICIFSYLYNWMKNQEEDYVKLNKRLDAFNQWWAKKELE